MGKKDKPAKAYAQFAALPWRRAGDGAVEVLLITSRETKRWVIPKGWPMADRDAVGTAAQEAWEEGGVRGRMEQRPLGLYGYDKWKNDRAQPMAVTVFALEVTDIADAWPEMDERERLWTSPTEAAARVAEPELAAILKRFVP
ncbi:NUDIX hydrolase [Phenylobacterium sp.]|jgi:8-oxo-dGTP pyrophosphatase MutT (NUDIX family)|uniref:NUDIX hydrolase n=1 Tax=Phenylobacterium sp. TaxID=1871053 RepID=UPI002F956D66